MEMASSLAFYSALSMAPLLIIALAIYSVIGEGSKEVLLHQLETLIGPHASETMRSISVNASQDASLRDIAGAIGIFSLLISAGAIFGHMRSAFNKIFEAPKAPNSENLPFVRKVYQEVKKRFFDVGLVLLFIAVALVSVLVSSGISMFLKGQEAVLGHFASFALSLLIFTVFFSLLYYFLPQVRVSKKIALASGLLTAILFTIGKSLIAYFLGRSAMASPFGAAGSLLVLLVWVYYSSVIVFISAEIAHEVMGNGKKPEQAVTPAR